MVDSLIDPADRDLDYSEVYAVLFQDADGRKEKMAPFLQEFYDWELAEELMEQYR